MYIKNIKSKPLIAIAINLYPNNTRVVPLSYSTKSHKALLLVSNNDEIKITPIKNNHGSLLCFF